MTGDTYRIGTDKLTVRYASAGGFDALHDERVYVRLSNREGRLFLGADAAVAQNQIADQASQAYKVNASSYFVGDSGRRCAGIVISYRFRCASISAGCGGGIAGDRTTTVAVLGGRSV